MTAFFVILCVALGIGLFTLAYIYIKEGKRTQLRTAVDTYSSREDRRTDGFWNGTMVSSMPMRDIAFSADERAAHALRVNPAPDITVKEEHAAEVQPESVAPKFDYVNIDGFPFEGTAYHQFKDEMTKHGFVMRFVMASKEIQVIYENPNDVEAPVLRKMYTPPSAIFPANLLHDKGCIITALWAMRKFKYEERLPELNSFAYL